MHGLARDVRYALRTLVARPVQLGVAVLTLGLGIGGSAALWSVVQHVLLSPLPYEDEERLVHFWHGFSWTPQEFLYLRGSFDGFEGVAAWTTTSATFRVPGGATLQAPAVPASRELFDVLGASPLLGRGFQPGDDAPGADPVVVLGHGLWQSELGGRPEALGRQVVIDGMQRTVVGIMPPDFYFPDRTVELWLPGPLDPENTAGNWSLLGRVPPGRTAETMDAELERITAALAGRFSYDDPRWDRTRQAALTPLRDWLIGDVRLALLLTLGATGLILLMACANVAALAVARSHARTRELAVRSALGASRGRIARELVVEALVLGALAAGVGALLTVGAFESVVAVLPLTDALARGLELDWTLFGVALALALGTGLLVGAAPAVAVLRRDLRGSLTGGRGEAGGRGRLERGLIVAEVAVAVLLVTGTGLMVRSVEQLRNVELGFEPEGLLAVGVTMGSADFPEDDRVRMWDRLREVAARLPGVASADVIQVPPLWGAGWNYGLEIEGREDPGVSTLYRIVSPGYFRTTGIDIVEGRGFEESDVPEGEPVVVVNEAFVREFFPDGRALGQRLNTGVDERWARVVGVAEDAATTGLREPAGPVRWVLGRQIGFVPETATLLVRSRSGSVADLAPSVREAVRDLDPRIAVARIEPMTEAHRRALGRTGQVVVLLGGLGGLALVLGAVGVYGVMSHFVGRRKREWGVRMALGQRPGRVLALILGRGMGLVGLGLLLGLGGAWVGVRSLSALLYDVEAHDPVSFAGAAAVLAAVGLVAAALPAWRASRVDPVVSLDAE